jgi:hypothetical protein
LTFFLPRNHNRLADAYDRNTAPHSISEGVFEWYKELRS